MTTVVTLKHLHSIPGYGPKPGFCNGQTREFFKRHGLDWNEFRHHGLPAEQLLATGDALAIALVHWAEECKTQEQQA